MRGCLRFAVVVAAISACGGHTEELGDEGGRDGSVESGAPGVDSGTPSTDATIDSAVTTAGGPRLGACSPGEQVACACTTAGRTGHQICNGLGTGFSPCFSGPPGPADAGYATSGIVDAGPPPPTNPTCGNKTCLATERCITLQGPYVPDAAPLVDSYCAPACTSDADCPAWSTCQAGTCAQCGPNMTCPLAQDCTQVGPANELPGSTAAFACVPCSVGNCTTCLTNNNCPAGKVCSEGECTTCSSDSQCGPSAHCTATHTTEQCTCSVSSDCADGELCTSGLCTAACCSNADCGPGESCTDGACGGFGGSGGNCSGSPDVGGSCAAGQGCVLGVCGPCSSFADCVARDVGPMGEDGVLACVDGRCVACTANSQCGGGQACVQGTCGSCVEGSQCGPSGDCEIGSCVCTSDAQCAPGQRCGSGFCVTK